MNSETSPAGRSEPLRIIITDDHPLLRAGLRQILNGRSDLKVVGEAANGREALELCRSLRPDLVLMDMRMPEMDGLSATRAIKKEFPRTIVLVLTALEGPSYLSEALKAGASGYILKHAAPQEIIDAVWRALAGKTPLDQELATRLLLAQLFDEAPEEGPEDLAPGRPSGKKPESPLPESLTAREVAVLRLVAQGQTNQEISSNLLVSVATVKKDMQRIIAKLGVSDRTQAVIRAMELGLLSEQERE